MMYPKTGESQKLANEIEKFLKNGGKIKQAVNSGLYGTARRKPKQSLNNETLEAAEQRRKMQKPALVEYAKWGGTNHWKKLSEAVGGKVSNGHFSKIAKGATSIKEPELWREVVAAIENLRKEMK